MNLDRPLIRLTVEMAPGLGRHNRVMNLSEDILVRKSQAGDSGAFTQLVQIHTADAYRTAFMVLHDRTEAEDVVQEAFLICFRKIKTFRLDSSFKTWLYRIVVNLCYDRMRKFGRENSALEKLPLNFGSVSRDMDEIETRIDLKDVILSLSHEHRMVLTLYYGMDFEIRQIAETMGIPVGTVKSRLNSARNLVRERMERGREHALSKQ